MNIFLTESKVKTMLRSLKNFSNINRILRGTHVKVHE